MKKLLLLLSFISLFYARTNAQLANASFESWTSIIYSDPTGWQSGNQKAAPFQGLMPVTEVSGVTGSAIRMQTVVYGSDTAQAYIANGDPGSGQGGIPCASVPTAITGFYRYNILGNDTGFILVIFKKNSSIIGMNMFQIKGTGVQNNFTQFSFPLTVSSTPDSVIIAATCSNLINNIGVTAGSFLELDALAFTGANITIPNANFETWTSSTLDLISGWETNGQVNRTTDSQDGQYAMELTTVDYGGGDVEAAQITNGHFTQNSGPVGGVPFTLMTDTLTGYYKYSSSGSDSGNIYMSASANGSNVGGGFLQLAPASQYTYFEIPISCMSAPDSLMINATSSKWPMSQTSGGSTLIIDHLALRSELTAGIKTVEHKNPFRNFAYPNPANSTISVSSEQSLHGSTTIAVYDTDGHLVKSENMSDPGNSVPLNISDLKNGMYFYKIICGNIVLQNSFIKN